MKNRHRPPSFPAIARRVITLVLAFWLTAMAMVSVLVAQDARTQLGDQLRQVVLTNDTRDFLIVDYPWEIPGRMELGAISELSFPYLSISIEQSAPFVLPQMPDSYGSDDWFYGMWDLLYGYKAAVVVDDAATGVRIQSGDWLYFPYLTAGMWKDSETEPAGYAYVDLDAIEGGETIADQWIDDHPNNFFSHFSYFCPYLRLTGWFEGNEFHPTRIDRLPNYAFISGPFSSGDPGLETVIRRDQVMGNLEWENIYDGGDTGRELVTIYGFEPGGYNYDPGSALTVNGVHYDSLVDALASGQYGIEKDSLFDSIMVCRIKHQDDAGEYTLAMAVRFSPLGYAALRLWPVYLVSFALLALCTWLLLRRIRLSLTTPLERILENRPPLDNTPPWKEPYELARKLADAEQAAHAAHTETQQLQTALDFARNAEENRRQLVAGITHELKTPLAVIHSYAEGLQAGIAGDKSDKYLSVILEEAERMDGMVLEMLDLSRLEAGKVRLSSDHFDLLILTRAIVERLSPAAQGKELIIQFSFAESCPVIADESRMMQVVTNLLTNAIKYTAPGGEVWVMVYQKNGIAHLVTENPGAHFPPEKLERLWDTFYQVDPSHASEGSGLGLAIVRSIVELHRGSCAAKNTYRNGVPCVEFHITIPVS